MYPLKGTNTATQHTSYCSPAAREILYFTPRYKVPTAARNQQNYILRSLLNKTDWTSFFLVLRMAVKGKRCGQWILTSAPGLYQTTKCYSSPARMGEGRKSNEPFLNSRASFWFSFDQMPPYYNCTEVGI